MPSETPRERSEADARVWSLWACPICGHAKTKPFDEFGAPGICQRRGHTAARQKIAVQEVRDAR